MCTVSTFDLHACKAIAAHHPLHVLNTKRTSVDETAEPECDDEGDSAEASTAGVHVSVAI